MFQNGGLQNNGGVRLLFVEFRGKNVVGAPTKPSGGPVPIRVKNVVIVIIFCSEGMGEREERGSAR